MNNANKILKPMYLYIIILVIGRIFAHFIIPDYIADYYSKFMFYILPAVALFESIRRNYQLTKDDPFIFSIIISLIPGLIVGIMYTSGFILSFGHAYDYIAHQLKLLEFTKQLIVYLPFFAWRFLLIYLALGAFFHFIFKISTRKAQLKQ